MELVLSAISAGGLVGAANQYLCLLIFAIISKIGWVTLTPKMQFMESWWFISIVALFWILTVAPAYLATLAPGVLNAVNTFINFLSGFLVPVSAAFISLASVGVLTGMHPELEQLLETLQLFNLEGSLARNGWLLAGTSALFASSVGGIKFATKPLVGAVSGTSGYLAAPTNATFENSSSVVLMTLAYLLSKVNPWLLVALGVLVFILAVAALTFALYQLWKLKKGIGKVLRWAQTNPRAGMAVFAEFLMWGTGWLIWEKWGRGVVMSGAWLVWTLIFFSLVGLTGVTVPFVAPPIIVVAVLIFLAVGLSSARSLMRYLEAQLEVIL